MNCRCALLTAAAAGGIAIVRIDGPDSMLMLKKIFIPIAGQLDTDALLSGKSLLFGSLRDGDETLDQVVVAYEPGLNAVDINCHGGMRIIQRLMILLKNYGAQVVDNKELILNESIESELQYYITKALVPKAVLAVANQYPAGLYQWAGDIIKSLENNDLGEIQEQVKDILATAHIGKKLLAPPMIVLVGPVNAGKSTLANALGNKAVSIASDLAGTTRDWTSQVVDIQGFAYRLVDTAGRRASDDILEQQSLILANDLIEKADLILLVAGADQLYMVEKQLEDLPENVNVLVVINKVDLTSDDVVSNCLKKGYICITAKEKDGFDQLTSGINDTIGLNQYVDGQPLVFTDRQRILLEQIMTTDNADDIKELLAKLRG
ncbi:MAG: GTP-binding protein [Phycisphaerae bacterium]|nr:GTP-binding protein [Phycisphaerae bacterium]